MIVDSKQSSPSDPLYAVERGSKSALKPLLASGEGEQHKE